jgi:hypothetical protein
MPRKQKANIAWIQNLQGGGDTSSRKRQKSMELDSDLSDHDVGNEEMASDNDIDDVVCLKSY